MRFPPINSLPSIQIMKPKTKTAINNLKKLDGAKEQWALENKKSAGSTVDSTGVVSYIKGSAMPICPGGGSYSLNNVDTPPTCSLTDHVII